MRERLIILALARPAMTSRRWPSTSAVRPTRLKFSTDVAWSVTSRSTKRTQCMIFPRTLMGVVRSKSFVLETLM